ncbi:MAG: prepilin-type N-terminal cleavage/methylation domain-containing protein [Desulfobacterales bacterium]|jgi:type IV pilus assembly protein PilV|nr:MAG: prepilin-type N-terminal cleavage/methylation domain-containing protein [Desulfobacterales bacterium]
MLTNKTLSKNQKEWRRGFSLIEVVIALSVFSIGILAIATLVISSIDENASARRVTEATALAEDRLERMMALSYENINDGESTEGAYTVSWDVAEDVMVEQTKSITITVTWRYHGSAHKVIIQQLMAPNA